MAYLRPKQICALLLGGDMKYSDIPETPYERTTVRDCVGDMLRSMVDSGDITGEQYRAITGDRNRPEDTEDRPAIADEIWNEPKPTLGTLRKGSRGKKEAE